MHSVYIHIPFCKNICTYCDFCKMYYRESDVSQYLKALQKEIKQFYNGEKIKTLYIGGGTPSALENLEPLFLILKSFDFDFNYECTFECNIEDITEEKLIFLLKNGVNRLSIGIQTFQEKYLSFLGRKHTREEAIQKIALARNVGFKNINVDLMYAFPGQTVEEVLEDLEIYLQLKIPHISTYSLILEPHTILYNQKIEPISEDLDRSMYDSIVNVLKQNHYMHYEVSNFALDGYSSKHNLTYWNNEPYYGFGLGASGYIEGMRYENTRSLTHYCEGAYRQEEDSISKSVEEENEYILGFRKMEGINTYQFQQKFNKDIHQNKIIKKLLKENKLNEKNGFIFVNPDYIYVMNSFLDEFIEG